MSVNVKDEPVGKVLDKLLLDRGFSWDLLEGGIILIKVQSKSSDKRQEFKITGKVTDQSGEVLPGVAILIKGDDDRSGHGCQWGVFVSTSQGFGGFSIFFYRNGNSICGNS